MTQIFISYRRGDSAAEAGRLQVTLRELLQNVDVFLDTDSIEPGGVWPERLHRALADSVALIVVMGPDWIPCSFATPPYRPPASCRPPSRCWRSGRPWNSAAPTSDTTPS